MGDSDLQLERISVYYNEASGNFNKIEQLNWWIEPFFHHFCTNPIAMKDT